MTLKRFVLIMLATTLICWGAFVIVIFRIDPYTSGLPGLSLFYLSGFFALWGSLSLVGLGLRMLILRQAPKFRHVGVSLRQALWFALLASIPLVLIDNGLFDWWISIFFVLGLAVLEGFFLSRSIDARASHQPKQPA